MLGRLAITAALMALPVFPVSAEPQGFMVGCTIENVSATEAYRSRASMLRDPNTVYVMVPIVNEGSHGLTLIPTFYGVNAGTGDQYQATARLAEGFIFTQIEPEPAYDTKTTRRETEIAVPLDFTSFNYLERMWRCTDGLCSVDTLTFSASCGDPRPL